MTAIRRHSMTAMRLLGVGLLFAVGFPQHGVGAPNAAPIAGTTTTSAAAEPSNVTAAGASARSADANGARGKGSVAFAGGESPQLRALRTQDQDLFKNLPDGAGAGSANAHATACEGAACRDAERASDADRQTPMAASDDAFFANLRMPELPIRPNERVKQYIEYFTQNSEGRRIFRTWLKRSGRYNKTIAGNLRDLLLPLDLQAVVFVESGYSPKAVSTAGAVGLWQLMADTARVYGLAVENDLDERRSIDRSSHAAVRLLADMRDRFGSWELALAAYNMGYKALVDRIKDVSTNDFWTLSQIDGVLPRETILYVPKVLATAVILRNLDRFGFDDTHVDPPLQSGDLDVPAGTALSVVARASGTSVRAIREMNPELLTDLVPDRGRTYAVHVPSSGIARAQSMLPRLLDQRDRDGLEQVASDDFDWGRDDLPRRAARHHYDPYAGESDDSDRDRDRAPQPRAPRAARSMAFGGDDGDRSPNAASAAASPNGDGRNVILYRVGESENVGAIARTFGTTPGQIIEDNYLDPDGKLQKGMLLIVEVSPKSMTKIMKKHASTRVDAAGSAGSAPEETGRADVEPPSPDRAALAPHSLRTPSSDEPRGFAPMRKAREFFPTDDMKTIGGRG